MSGALPRAMLVFSRALLMLAVAVRFLASPAPALAQQLQGFDVEVLDANGIKVGSNVIGVQDRGPLVAFNLEGRVFMLVVTEMGFEGAFPGTNNFSTMLFQSPDCFGTPFLFDNSLFFPNGSIELSLLPPVAVVPPNNTVYLPLRESFRQSITVSSQLFSNGFCENLLPQGPMQAFPAQAIVDLNTFFVPPFRVRIR